MLVISRKPGESIVVGPATIKIVKLQGSSVRLGIDAPKHWGIYRQEAEQATEPVLYWSELISGGSHDCYGS